MRTATLDDVTARKKRAEPTAEEAAAAELVHQARERGLVPDRPGRNGTRPKTVLTEPAANG